MLRSRRGWIGFGLMVMTSLLVLLSAGRIGSSFSLTWGTPVQAQSVAGGDLGQQGLQQYEAGQYGAAIDLWQQALGQATQPKDKAILHNNLAQAFQQIGQTNQAITQWQAALDIYRTEDSEESRRMQGRVLTDQAQAYSDLGQHQRAIDLLQTALLLARQGKDTITEAAVQGSLGSIYLALGNYDPALEALQTSLTLSRQQGKSELLGIVLNNLGNFYTTRAGRYQEQSDSALNEGETEEADRLRQLAQQDSRAAIAAYQEGLALGKPASTIGVVKTLLNLNRLLAEQPEPKQNRGPASQAHILGLLKTLPNSQDKAYALINLAVQSPLAQDRLPILDQALQVARAIGDRRAESYALGSLGETYETENQLPSALDWSRQAQFAAQQVNAADSLYRWQWLSARLLQKQGQTTQAIDAYRQAISTLQSIRGDIVTANRELQFNFRDSVEPVYRELIELLLDTHHPLATSSSGLMGAGKQLPIAIAASDNSGSNSEAITQALNVLEFLKLAELQNFFGNECVQLAEAMDHWQFAWETPQPAAETVASAKQLSAEPEVAAQMLMAQTGQGAIDPNTTVIYSVILNHRSEMILRFPDGRLVNRSIPLGRKQMQQEIDKLRTLLEKRSTEEYLPQVSRVYDILMRPLEADLIAAKAKNLVFIQDGVLRKVPMAALYDGQKFLIEKYSLATTPSLSLTNTKPFDHDRLQALILGLTVERPPFAALPNVKAESETVQQILGGTILLDQDFTLGRLQEQVQKSSYSVIHMATHGKFGVDNNSTFLLGYDTRITIDQIDNLLRQRHTSQPVELLTLSACQTAAGDNRSALGIAGVAVRAGVRSALATLWFINDESTVPLVQEFYQQLRKPGMTKAEALRSAQLSMLHNIDFAHPAVWSPFILIGNWL